MSAIIGEIIRRTLDDKLRASDLFVHDWVTGDEAAPIASNATVTEDTEYVRVGTKSWRLTTSGAVTGQARWEFSATEVRPNALGVSVYIEDVSKVTGIWLEFRTTEGRMLSYGPSNYPSGMPYLKSGWNYLRWPVHTSIYPGGPDFGTWNMVRVLVVTSEATSVVIDRIWMEGFKKAKLIFVHDGGYTSFLNGRGYHDLFIRRIPVTWAIIPNLLGTGPYMTEAELLAVARENDNEVSIHSWSGEDLSVMDDEALFEESLKAINWLRDRGLEGRRWRAAWHGNNAPAAASPTASVRKIFLAYGMPGGGLSQAERLQPWPPANRYNIPRFMLHTHSEQDMDDIFEVLRSVRGVYVAYTHNIGDASGDISEPMWDYWLGKVDAAVSEGWLEGTTFSRLLNDNWDHWQHTVGRLSE